MHPHMSLSDHYDIFLAVMAGLLPFQKWTRCWSMILQKMRNLFMLSQRQLTYLDGRKSLKNELVNHPIE